MLNLRALLFVLTIPWFVTGCQIKEISPNIYAQDQVGVVSKTYPGRIISVRTVQIKSSDDAHDTANASAVGAVGGGLAGYALGRSGGATLAGSLAGAVAGAVVGDKSSKKNAYEYTIELDDGQKVTVVQGTQSPLMQNQRVLLITSANGRSRVVKE